MHFPLSIGAGVVAGLPGCLHFRQPLRWKSKSAWKQLRPHAVSVDVQLLLSNASMSVFLSVVPLRAAGFASSQQGPWRGSNGDLFEIVFLRNALVPSLVVADPILRRPVPCRHSPGDPEHVAGLERHAYCPFQSDRLPNGEAMNVHCWILLLARSACSASSRSAASSSEWSIPTSWLLRRSAEEMAGM